MTPKNSLFSASFFIFLCYSCYFSMNQTLKCKISQIYSNLEEKQFYICTNKQKQLIIKDLGTDGTVYQTAC